MDDDPEMADASPTPCAIDLADLPEDVLLLVLDSLHPWDFVRSRQVSKAWHRLFKHADYLRIMLKKYATAREVRSVAADGALSSPAETSDIEWCDVFDKIASRYFHLTHGRARSVSRFKSVIPEHVRLAHWHPVSPWDYHESQPGGRLYYLNPLSPWEKHANRQNDQTYLFRPSFWSYEDGLLVYSPPKPSEYRWDPRSNMTVPVHFDLVLVDLKTDVSYDIPFDLTKRVVRNFRLKDRTLVVEWAEETSFHALNDLERVHRHFASCYDVQLDCEDSDDKSSSRSWTVSFRCEYKLHFLGLPLHSRDRFFSTHNRTHYAIYFWQPNRSMYTGDEELPIESLFVWDISQPSAYQPSLDPFGRNKPQASTPGPTVLARFSFRDLDHLGVRQHSAISLMSLHLDSPSCTLTIRENVCVVGQGYFDPAERLWCARMTSFPFLGQGPHQQKEWDGNLPPYRGHGSMESVDVREAETWYLGIMDVLDDQADVRFSLVETVFRGPFVENRKLVRIEVWGSSGDPASLDNGSGAVNGQKREEKSKLSATLDDDLAREVCHMGRIAGDERYLVGQNEKQEVVVLKF